MIIKFKRGDKIIVICNKRMSSSQFEYGEYPKIGEIGIIDKLYDDIVYFDDNIEYLVKWQDRDSKLLIRQYMIRKLGIRNPNSGIILKED